MPNAEAEITITQGGIASITVRVSPGLHGLQGLLEGVKRSAWALEALDAAVRLGCKRGDDHDG
jgi:hypothetical protein